MSIVINSPSRSRPALPAAAPPVRPARAPPPLQLHAERLSDRLAASIAAQIEGGSLQPDARLPTEQQLAETYGVSRTVVREAVHQLKSRALVRSRQGSGVFVAPEPPHRPLAFDPRVLESMDAVVHVVELRRVLEGEIAALAATRATRAQVQALKRALKAIDQAQARGDDAVAEDMAFHRAIADGTGNPQFVLLLVFLEQYLREAMRVTKGNEARHKEFMQQVRLEHRAIVDAIASHNPAAARKAAIDHLLHGEWRLQAGGVTRPRRAALVR